VPCVVKYSVDLKASIVKVYLEGDIGFRASAIHYQISQAAFKSNMIAVMCI
jgi:hypothetical protein